MALLDYNYNSIETFKEIADTCGTTVGQLMLLNNIQPPYPAKPSQVSGLNGSIKVPEIYSGGETVENVTMLYNSKKYTQAPALNKPTNNVQYVSQPITALGSAVQGKCYISDSNKIVYFPCFPDSYSDSHTASVTPQTPLGRSEPFQIYQNSGPRTVSVEFRMDREMARKNEIGQIVGFVQSLTYPTGSGTIIPRCTLVIGDNCYITGIVTDVSTNWSDTIINNVYMIATLSFSVIECTGNPKTQGEVAARWGR